MPQLVIHSLFLPIVAWAAKTIGMHGFLRDGPDTWSHGALEPDFSAHLLRSVLQTKATVGTKTLSTLAKPIPAGSKLSDE